MATSTETRKDIFRFNSQGQLELPELTAKNSLNTIEFRPNDGIYVNGVRLEADDGPLVENTTIADYTSPTPPPLVIAPTVPLGRTYLEFNSFNYPFSNVGGTNIEIPYTENPAKPFSTISKIIPIIRQKDGKGNHIFGIDIFPTFVFDVVAGTFVLSLEMGTIYGDDGEPLRTFVIEIDFLVA